MKKITMSIMALLFVGLTTGCQLTVEDTATSGDGSTSSPVTIYDTTIANGWIDSYGYSYYSVVATGTGTAAVYTGNYDVSADLDLFVYSDSGFSSLITSAQGIASTAESTSTFSVVAGYTYYIKVSNWENYAVNYQIVFQ